MFVCLKSSNIEGNACRSDSDLISVDAKYCSSYFILLKVCRNNKRISLMTNYVPINNTILRDIVCCFNSQYWSRFMNKRVGLVFDEKTHCFQSYNEGYRNTGNN